jgi:hypothetical protein
MIVQPGNGYGFSSSGYGVSLDIGNPFPDDVGNKFNPLSPRLSGDKVTIEPGTVNRYIPKIGANYIDATPAPTLTVTGEGYVLIKATYEVNKFFPRTAEAIFASGSTVPADTNSESYYPIAKINTVSSGGVTTYTLSYLTSNGNLIVNRLKAGASIATWYWDVIN